MINVLLYPFDRNSIPILEFREKIDNLNIKSIVSPSGWGLEGEKYVFDNQSYTVECDFENELEKCDAVLIVNSNMNIYPNDLVLNKIKYIQGKCKQIYYARDNEKERDWLKKNSPNVIFLSQLNNKDKSNEFFGINTPIICVCGMGEDTDKFFIQLGIRNFLKNKGYKVSQIGSRNDCQLFNFYGFPKYMLEPHNEKDKIIYFNQFLKKIEVDENPDIFVLGIPGGIMALSDKWHNDFGCLMYEISQAVSIDYLILSMYYENYDLSFYEKISEHISNRFGLKVDTFNMTNRRIDYLEKPDSSILSFFSVEKELVKKTVHNYNVDSIVCLQKKEDFEFVNKIILDE